MTYKRFINHDDTILDNYGEQLISTDEIVDKLNQLHYENKQLGAEVSETNYEYNMLILEQQKLEKENKELKQSNKDAWNLIQFIYDEIKEEGSMDWGRIQDLVEF